MSLDLLYLPKFLNILLELADSLRRDNPSFLFNCLLLLPSSLFGDLFRFSIKALKQFDPLRFVVFDIKFLPLESFMYILL